MEPVVWFIVGFVVCFCQLAAIFCWLHPTDDNNNNDNNNDNNK